MPTRKNAAYKNAQKRAKQAYRTRGRVLWVSCELVESGIETLKVRRQGTYTNKWRKIKHLGKAKTKALRRLTHTKGYYLKQRSNKDSN